MIQRWLRRRLGVDESDLDDDPDDESPKRGLLVRKGRLVALRTHVSANREAFQCWYGDQEIAELLRHDLEPLNDIQSQGYFDTFIMPSSARGNCFAIHERRSKRLIGTTALTDRSMSKSGPSALFRIVIGEKDTWGRGYGTEATRLVMEEAFDAHGLNEVRLEVFGHNQRAVAAYRRVGFEMTGEHVEWVPKRKVELRVIEMRLTKEAFLAKSDEWPPSKRGAASKGFQRDRAERAAQRATRQARREGRQGRRIRTNADSRSDADKPSENPASD